MQFLFFILFCFSAIFTQFLSPICKMAMRRWSWRWICRQLVDNTNVSMFIWVFVSATISTGQRRRRRRKAINTPTLPLPPTTAPDRPRIAVLTLACQRQLLIVGRARLTLFPHFIAAFLFRVSQVAINMCMFVNMYVCLCVCTVVWREIIPTLVT